MNANNKPCFSSISVIIIYSTLLIVLNPHPSEAAVDSLFIGQSLSGNKTLVSKGGKFELGFFSPSNSRRYYIGIWYKMIPANDIVWVANRRTPVLNPSTAVLKLSDDGNLVLLKESDILVWSSNSTRSTSSSAVAVLLDSSNLVISNGTSNFSDPIWQSFDHPSHTLMPGGWLGMNKRTGEYQSMSSWRSLEDPSAGLYTLGLDPDGTDQVVAMYNGSLLYWSTGLWNDGNYFANLPWLRTFGKTQLDLAFIDNGEGKRVTYNFTDPSIISYGVLDPSGLLKVMLWMIPQQQWTMMYFQPNEPCQAYPVCGAFGLCNSVTSYPVSCSCYTGFEPASKENWYSGAWSSGCSRRTSLHCNQSNSTREGKDGFIKMQVVQLPSGPKQISVRSAKECELACQSICSCTAYAYDKQCSIWSGDLLNTQQLGDGDQVSTLNLRLAASDLPSPTSSKSHTSSKTAVIFSIIAAVMFMVFAILGLLWARLWARRRGRCSKMVEQVEGSLVLFTYNDLQRMTKNFSERLGTGGFGSVFRGTLPDSTIIAAKKFEGTLGHGEKQFRAEVSTLGLIQHVNLVRLRGFCCEGSKRILVYDYMSKGSLGSYLFGYSKLLDWKARYKIILGIARGLAYLHEKCRECVIHCDIKPDNILLDAELSPKVADFGMAKLIGRNFSNVLTTTRGTRGYLAPEWISGLPITPKVDVYSFGMVLFEVVSGNRNWNFSKYESNNYFPVRVASKLIKKDQSDLAEDNLIDLLDERLEGEANVEELNRVCRVAGWCIQDSDADRPTMGQVVQMLEGVLDVEIPRFPKSLHYLMEDYQGSTYYCLPLATESS